MSLADPRCRPVSRLSLAGLLLHFWAETHVNQSWAVRRENDRLARPSLGSVACEPAHRGSLRRKTPPRGDTLCACPVRFGAVLPVPDPPLVAWRTPRRSPPRCSGSPGAVRGRTRRTRASSQSPCRAACPRRTLRGQRSPRRCRSRAPHRVRKSHPRRRARTRRPQQRVRTSRPRRRVRVRSPPRPSPCGHPRLALGARCPTRSRWANHPRPERMGSIPCRIRDHRAGLFSRARPTLSSRTWRRSTSSARSHESPHPVTGSDYSQGGSFAHRLGPRLGPQAPAQGSANS